MNHGGTGGVGKSNDSKEKLDEIRHHVNIVLENS